jgi:glycine cleavage system regulatory protein
MSKLTHLVLTAIGADRPGLVSTLSETVAAGGGNWLDARMSSLAGQFAGMLLVEVTTDRADALVDRLRDLESQGLRLAIERSEAERQAPGERTLNLELLAHDRPGIVREISRVLAALEVSIADFETERTSGSFSGEAMFKARALLQVPDRVAVDAVREALEDLASDMMVDLSFEPGSTG